MPTVSVVCNLASEFFAIFLKVSVVSCMSYATRFTSRLMSGWKSGSQLAEHVY